jgi:hypothetical protein
MIRMFAVAALALLFLGTAPVSASNISGQYVEARTCDVWTGPCFANADMNLGGKNAVLAWKVDKGSFDKVRLDGLGVVAVVAASDTLGLDQTGPARAVLLVDKKANAAQRTALIGLARKQGGQLIQNVVAVQPADIRLTICNCKGGACAELQAGAARIKTRCIDAKHDKACGNESAYYPPLAKGVKVLPATAVEHNFTGKGLKETWKESGRRGAYVGSFGSR